MEPRIDMYAIARRFTARERRAALKMFNAEDIELLSPIGALLRVRFPTDSYGTNPTADDIAQALVPYDADDSWFGLSTRVLEEAARFIEDFDKGRMNADRSVATALGLRT